MLSVSVRRREDVSSSAPYRPTIPGIQAGDADGHERISPGAAVSRISEIYRAQFPVLAGTAVIAYTLQFLISCCRAAGSGTYRSSSGC
ncbi:MAG: hypothetical protein JO280_02025 [Mycobacteriaceae bacterium]|nr:hypothetical protein [Mycobacteriaceae bacterium]